MKFNVCTQNPIHKLQSSSRSSRKREKRSEYIEEVGRRDEKSTLFYSQESERSKKKWLQVNFLQSFTQYNSMFTDKCIYSIVVGNAINFFPLINKPNNIEDTMTMMSVYLDGVNRCEWFILTRCPAGMLMLKSFIKQSLWFACFNDTRRNSILPHCGHFSGNDSSWK